MGSGAVELHSPQSAGRRAHATAMAAAWAATDDLAAADHATFAARRQLEPRWAAEGVPLDFVQRLVSCTLEHAEGRDLGDADLSELLLEFGLACCHPQVPMTMRTMLVLRAVAGLDEPRLASIFGIADTTLRKRKTMAFKRANIDRTELRGLSPATLTKHVGIALPTLQLIFDEGYIGLGATECGEDNLSQVAIDITRQGLGVAPDALELRAMLASMLLQDARRKARIRDDGTLEPMWSQDRALWDRAKIEEGLFLVRQVQRHSGRSRWELMARIEEHYVMTPSYDRVNWPLLVDLYTEVLSLDPDPIIGVARVTAIAQASGAQQALNALEQLNFDHPMAHDTRAYLLHQLGKDDEAEQAHAQSENVPRIPSWHIHAVV